MKLAGEFPDYSGELWGITASDSAKGYVVWGGPPRMGPIDGSIVPCAAGGSLPFLPRETLQVLRVARERFGKQIWNQYAFADAFNPANGCAGSRRHQHRDHPDDGGERAHGFLLGNFHEKFRDHPGHAAGGVSVHRVFAVNKFRRGLGGPAAAPSANHARLFAVAFEVTFPLAFRTANPASCRSKPACRP